MSKNTNRRPQASKNKGRWERSVQRAILSAYEPEIRERLEAEIERAYVQGERRKSHA